MDSRKGSISHKPSESLPDYNSECHNTIRQYICTHRRLESTPTHVFPCVFRQRHNTGVECLRIRDPPKVVQVGELCERCATPLPAELELQPLHTRSKKKEKKKPKSKGKIYSEIIKQAGEKQKENKSHIASEVYTALTVQRDKAEREKENESAQLGNTDMVRAALGPENENENETKDLKGKTRGWVNVNPESTTAIPSVGNGEVAERHGLMQKLFRRGGCDTSLVGMRGDEEVKIRTNGGQNGVEGSGSWAEVDEDPAWEGGDNEWEEAARVEVVREVE